MTESESEPEPEPESKSESEPEPEPEPEPEAAASEAAVSSTGLWQPPLTFSDYFSHYSVRAIQTAVVLIGLSILVCFVLWAVPGVVAATSDDYATFKERVERDSMLKTYLGAPVRCERVPLRYEPTAGGVRYAAIVSGAGGRAIVEGEVENGKVVRYTKRLAVDWSRPLLETLGPRKP